MTARRPTIADVARSAGVSPSTASVVFSGKTAVSDATRQRVLQAAETLGYAGPDPRAASLRRGRSGIVGVVFEEHLRTAFDDPVQAAMMDGLAAAVAPLGAALLLLRDSASPIAPADAGPTLAAAPIDAAVLVGCSTRLRESLATVNARGLPVAVIEGDAGSDVPRIDLDNREAQRRIAGHVRGLGHERVALLTLPTDAARLRGRIDPDREAAVTVDVTRTRLAGARDVFPDAPAFSAARSSVDEGVAVGRMLLADAATRPTAIIAQSDLLAAGVLRAALEAGLDVPRDLSITGFDGVAVDGIAPYRLTTMAQPAVEKGRAAGDAVAAMLAGRAAASVRLTCTFHAGSTTAQARP